MEKNRNENELKDAEINGNDEDNKHAQITTAGVGSEPEPIKIIDEKLNQEIAYEALSNLEKQKVL
jgi:hypothetical protein